MSDFDFDLLQEIASDAPVAGFGPQVNFGKCTIDVNINAWDNTAKKFVVRPFDGKPLGQGEYLRLTFKVDVTELNPMLTKPYSRNVDVKKSGSKAKTDWSETVEKSLLQTLGKDYFK